MRAFTPLLLCLFLPFTSLQAHAQAIYQHTLANGEVVFSDSAEETGTKNTSPIQNSKQLIQAEDSYSTSSISNSKDDKDTVEAKFKTLGTTKLRADKLKQLKETVSKRYASRSLNHEKLELVSSTMIEYQGEMYKRLEFKYGKSSIVPWLDSGNRIFKMHQHQGK